VKIKIQKLIQEAKNSIAILIDPEKDLNFEEFSKKISECQVDFLFVGGSTSNNIQIESTLKILKKHFKKPIIIFPGSPDQVSSKADAILFLSLISGRNPYYLIESQIEAAEKIYRMKLECIATSYLLIDGLSQSSVSKVSKTKPIPIENPNLIFKTALAGKLLGHTVTYLEAGSGARRIIPKSVIKRISKLDTVLIVGGGVKSISNIRKLHDAGANIVVIGNYIEGNIEFLDEINDYKNQSKQG